tara:strand:+ start:231 stop:458 length:228 start_codon:yes stop_codon:yes gene_type:complete
MPKSYFHNDKPMNEDIEKKKSIKVFNQDKKKIVDVNILLNRVKIEEQIELKKKIFFFSFVLITLSLFGTLIVIIK